MTSHAELQGRFVPAGQTNAFPDSLSSSAMCGKLAETHCLHQVKSCKQIFTGLPLFMAGSPAPGHVSHASSALFNQVTYSMHTGAAYPEHRKSGRQ